jgi:hypothetical protein
VICDLAELPVAVIRQNVLYVGRFVCIVRDWAELPVCGQCANDLAELPVPMIWQNCLCQ